MAFWWKLPLSVCRDSSGGSSSQLAKLVHFLSVLCHPYTLGSFPMSQLRDSHLDGQAQEAKNVMHDA